MKYYTLLLLTIFSCSKYEQNSIYHYSESNLPKVDNESLSITNGCIDVTGTVSQNGTSQLLRVGHIWGNSVASLNFANNPSLKPKETNQVSQNLPFTFKSKICQADIEADKPLYVTSYAINEIGIKYGSPITISPVIEFSKPYKIIEEQNNDNKINSGERVKLQFFITNKSPVNCLSTKIESLSYFVNQLPSVEPRLNIDILPSNKVSYNGENYFYLTVVPASNASGDLEISANVASSNIVSGATAYKSTLKILLKIN
jgi:hypothetical protein